MFPSYDIPILTIGGPYFTKPEPPYSEGIEFNYQEDWPTLLFSFPNFREQEIADINHGECRFGAVVLDRVLFFLLRFGKSWTWSDAPYNYWLNKQDERPIPVLESAQTRILLKVIAVDSRVNRIVTMRAVTIPPHVTKTIVHAIYEQARSPLPTGEDYSKLIESIRARYTPEQLVTLGVSGKGGE